MTLPRARSLFLAIAVGLLVAPTLGWGQTTGRFQPPDDWDRLVDPSLPAAPAPYRVNLGAGRPASASSTPAPAASDKSATRDADVTPTSGNSGNRGADQYFDQVDQYFREIKEAERREVIAGPARTARAAIEHQDWDEARVAIEQVRRLEPDGLRLLDLQVNLDGGMGRRQHVIATCSEAIRRHPEHAGFWLMRGLTRCTELDRGGLADIAEGTRLAALPGASVLDSPVAHYRFSALVGLGDHAAAVALFDEAIAGTPGESAMRLGLVQELLTLGQTSRALAELDVPMPPEYALAVSSWRAYALVYAGRFAEALALLEGLPPLENDNVQADLLRGICLVALGRTAEARAGTDSLRSRRPESNAIACLDGAIALAERQFARAYQVFSELADKPEAKLYFGCAYGAKHLLDPSLDWAVTHFDERCRAVPNLPWALVLRLNDEARTSLLPGRELAIALVARTQADANLAPALCLYAHAYREVNRYRSVARAGQVAAALALGDRAKLIDSCKQIYQDLGEPTTLRAMVQAELHAAWRNLSR